MDRATRKALTQRYKLTLPPMGIFAIRNTITGRMLIDQSANLTGAMNRHLTELKLGTHRNQALMDDWRALGEASFTFDTLQRIDERPEPDFDYKAEMARLLEAWRIRIPPGSALSYV
ncbi:GIY-YIG nuclease family protein [Dyella sp. C11]|uniref:GIY-YIG nuclease family protein n=1 Tax=Dyella sp. C11 TaxID=2126991 RepID=UPI000D651B45|nr:GIY-YIG nuclease family protein [Dyella sp. C11]